MTTWRSAWNGYTLILDAPSGLQAETTTRLSLTATAPNGSSAASGWLKYRPEDHCDAVLNKWFDTIVLSNLEIAEGYRRRGLGTAIVRAVARHFPRALIVGENPNADAVRWHRDRLERDFPTRMLDVESPEARVSPGKSLDPQEIV